MTHSFNIQIAKRYGLHEAIMISNFQFWISKNLANKNHHHDGRTWTYNSVRAFEELFPYLTSWQIRKSLESLVEQGVLLKGNYHKNPYERSCWYAFSDESLFLDSQNHLCSTSNGDDKNIKSITDDKPDSKEKVYKKKESKTFVPPTYEQVFAYFAENGQNTSQARKAFDHYNNHGWKDSHGKKVQNWKQKIQTNWFKTQEETTFNKSILQPKDEGDAQMYRILEKGLDKISGEELAWVFDWQHRTNTTYLEYADDIRIVGRCTRVTKAQANEMNKRDRYEY